MCDVLRWYGIQYAVVCCGMRNDAFLRLREKRANQGDISGIPEPGGKLDNHIFCFSSSYVTVSACYWMPSSCLNSKVGFIFSKAGQSLEA